MAGPCSVTAFSTAILPDLKSVPRRAPGPLSLLSGMLSQGLLPTPQHQLLAFPCSVHVSWPLDEGARGWRLSSCLSLARLRPSGGPGSGQHPELGHKAHYLRVTKDLFSGDFSDDPHSTGILILYMVGRTLFEDLLE